MRTGIIRPQTLVHNFSLCSHSSSSCFFKNFCKTETKHFSYLHPTILKSHSLICLSYTSNGSLSSQPLILKSQYISKRFNMFCTIGRMGFKCLFFSRWRQVGQFLLRCSHVSMQTLQKTWRHGLSTGPSSTH